MPQKTGCLIMAANHIGDPRDCPYRTIQSVQTAHILVFESKDGARKLLKSANIHRDYWIFSEHKESQTLGAVDEALASGRTVLYASDQGCPTLADPGRDLLLKAKAHKAHIQVIPGPSAVTGALSACPFDINQYFYMGFLPQKKSDRLKDLLTYSQSIPGPWIILDAPYRLKSLLEDLESIFPGSCDVFLALNISLEDEAYLVAKNFKDLRVQIASLDKKNFVLIMGHKGLLLT